VLVVIFVLAVPVSYVGAHRFLRRITHGNWAPLWGAVTYSLLPVLSGAVAQGRIGTVVAAALLPWFGVAATGLAADDTDAHDADPNAGATRRWRSAWRAGLVMGLMTAFAPTAYLAMLVVLVFA